MREIESDLADAGSGTVASAMSVASRGKRGTTAFQALLYLRRVCNHPSLVLSSEHPRYADVLRRLSGSSDRQKLEQLAGVEHSGKLIALKELLVSCGIGTSDSGGSALNVAEQDEETLIAPHRALVFCQSRGMIDLIERQLFQ